MRLEITIPDDTRPELKSKLTSLTERLSANPELIEELMTEKGEPIPDYMASVALIRSSPNCFKTPQEVDAYITELRNEW